MMIFRRLILLALVSAPLALAPASGQTPVTPPAQDPQNPVQNPGQKPAPTPPSATDAGPATDSGQLISKKMTTDSAEAPPPAPDREKIKNPNGETYSLRVDVPIVSLDVNVILDKTHSSFPG